VSPRRVPPGCATKAQFRRPARRTILNFAGAARAPRHALAHALDQQARASSVVEKIEHVDAQADSRHVARTHARFGFTSATPPHFTSPHRSAASFPDAMGKARAAAAAFVVVAVFSAAGCRSPFEEVKDEKDDWRVGRGVHAWPIYERAPGETETRTDLLWPVASLRADAAGSLTSAEFVWPIVHYLDAPPRSEFAVRPLFDVESVAPSEDDAEGSYEFQALLGLFDWKDGKDERLRRALLYESKTTKDEDRWFVFPFLWHGKDADSDWTHAWPLYGEEHKGTFSKQWTLAPLFSLESDPAKDASGWDAFWPLFHFDHDKDSTHVRALPLYWHDFGPDAQATVVFPLWWDFEDKDSKFQMLFPFYGRQTRGETFERTAYTPFWIDTKDGKERSTDLALSLVGWTTSEEPETWSWHAFPLLWFGKDREYESYAHVIPFYGEWKNRDESGWYAPLGLVIHTQKPKESSWNFVGPLLHFETGEDSRETAVFPLFRDERHEGHTETHLLLDIVANWEAWEKPQTSDGNVLFGLLAHWESDKKENTDSWRVLWRLVHASTTEHKSTFAVNPLYRHESNDRGDDYWSVLFGLVARKREAGETSWRFLWVL
jgi:hypothetical protein